MTKKCKFSPQNYYIYVQSCTKRVIDRHTYYKHFLVNDYDSGINDGLLINYGLVLVCFNILVISQIQRKIFICHEKQIKLTNAWNSIDL